MHQRLHHAPGSVRMTAWRVSSVGVLIPVQHKAQPMPWPRPAGWDQLPADIRAAWDAKWRPVVAQRAGVQ